jgi:probable DNA repair protein
MSAFQASVRELPHTLTPTGWTERFLHLLEVAGWPHATRLNSEEYQQVQSWRELLAKLATLEMVQPGMELRQALRSLRALADGATFQPQTPEAPLQILGVMEAVGLEFDHLWIMGLSDEEWPQAAAPNPLLPVGLQRELKMPHSSAGRELEYSTLLAQRLFSAAPRVIVSYPLLDEDKELRPSPLLRELPQLKLEQLDLAIPQDLYREEFGTVELEPLLDEPLAPLETGTHMYGGTAIFSDQAICPFKAFANHRLDASTIEEPTSGLDPIRRGIVLHRVLELVWRWLGDQASLLATAPSGLQGILNAAIEQNLQQLRPKKPLTLTPKFIALEQERLRRLVQQWLQFEAERPPFSVQELEERRQISLGGLEFSIKADRIDRLEDGTLLVLDYKSGKAQTCKGWFDERLDEPQLPLYASTCEGSVAGVYRAYLQADGSVLRGVSQRAGVVPGDKPFTDLPEAEGYGGWDDLLQQWRTNLERLAQEIREGRVEVDPKSCDYCHLTPLCRIHEQRAGEW